MRRFAGVLGVLLVTSMLIAGTKGKIAGKITDASTNEPLVGASVIVNGTTLGASTDVEGEYYIINVPPGIYTLTVRLMGYNPKAVEQVRVQVDLTTKVNVSLEQTTIQMAAVTVTTTRREVQKDLSSSERTMQPDQIEALPARDVTSILSIQAGITKDAGGQLHIRGGRSTEINYMVDGVQIMNSLNRSAGINIDDQSIEELKVVTGTFNAEYGQALSGVVNIVTKRGSDKFTVNVTGYAGDYLSFDKQLFSTMTDRAWAEAAARSLTTKTGVLIFDFSKYGIASYAQLNNALSSYYKPWQTTEAYLTRFNPVNRYDLQVNLSGPLPDLLGKMSYFVAGRFQNYPSAEHGRRYFMPWGLWSPVSDTVHTFSMPDGDLVPLGTYEGYSTQSKVFWDLKNLDVSYALYYNYDHSYGGGSKYLPDAGRHYYTTRLTHVASVTYVFSASTILDFKGSYYSNNGKGYLYEDPFDYRYMPSQAGDFQQFMFHPSREDDVEVKTNPDDFPFWGNDVGRSHSIVRYFSGTLDLTSQINKHNLVKLGASARFHSIENDNYSLQFSQVNYRPIVPDQSSAFHTHYTAKPYEFAAYLQDKIEFEELIINVGLRFDYFYSDGRTLADPRDPQIYAPFKFDHIYKNFSPTTPQDSLIAYSPAERAAFWYKKPDPKYQVSPRVGLSFPITAEGVLHFSYGHFFQNPEFQYLYTNPNFWIAGAGSQNLVGNANLDAERTVMYEVGLQQKLFGDLLLHVTGFYRDIRDWIGTGFPVDTYRGLTYYSYVNKDNAVSKGLTFSGSYVLAGLSLSLDYTYMETKGTSSNPIDAYNDLGGGRAPRVQLINLNWDQPHSLNIVASYSKESWTATLVGSMASGFPYTPEIARGEATGTNAYIGWQENSERKPSTMNFDLHLSKSFDLGSIRLRALLDVTNIFDTRNARYVYNDTGLPNFTLQDYLSRNRLVEVSNSTEYYRNPGMYSTPRSITLGLRVSYE